MKLTHEIKNNLFTITASQGYNDESTITIPLAELAEALKPYLKPERKTKKVTDK